MVANLACMGKQRGILKARGAMHTDRLAMACRGSLGGLLQLHVCSEQQAERLSKSRRVASWFRLAGRLQGGHPEGEREAAEVVEQRAV